MSAAYLRAPAEGYEPGRRCRKIPYATREIAMRALRTVSSRGKQGMGALRTYRCDICPNAWHHGHPPRKN